MVGRASCGFVAAGLLSGLLAVGCGHDVPWQDTSAEPSRPLPTDPTQPPSGIEPAYLEEALAWLPGRVEQLLVETGVPGVALSIVHGGETIYAEGFGQANRDTGAKVDADTVFQLASVSKPIGATVIARLVSEGIVAWNTRVREQLPWFSLGQPWLDEHVTIGDLYAHRAGLIDHAGDDLGSLGFDRRTVLERLRLLPMGEFRASYAYTNYGIMLGALAAAEAANQPWEELSRTNLYEPLGMKRTTSKYEEFVALENRAVGHANWGGEWGVWPHPFNDDDATAAGGVASSAKDLAQWIAMILRNGIVQGEEFIAPSALVPALSAQNFVEPRVPFAALPDPGYGYGFMVTTTPDGFKSISHSGAFSQGAATQIAILPTFDLGIVVLTNGIPIGLAETIAMEFLDYARGGADYQTSPWWELYERVFRQQLWSDFGELTGKERPKDASPPRELNAYVGVYSNEYYGEAKVEREGQRLRLSVGPRPGALGTTWLLDPWDGDRFRISALDSPDVSPSSTSEVRFDLDEGSLWFELFDHMSRGLGTLRRDVGSL